MRSILNRLRPGPAPAPQRRLGTRTLDDLPRVSGLEALLAAERDSIWLLDAPGEGQREGQDAPPGEIGDRPYILCLRDACVLTGVALQAPDLPPGRHPLPAGMKGAGKQVVVTADGHLLPDSFTRNRQVPQGLAHVEGDWIARFAEDRLPRRAGTHLFAEMIHGHFGHALVDGMARLWPFAVPELAAGLADVPVTGIGLGRVRGPSAGWSPYVRGLLEGAGIDPARCSAYGPPARYERLLIPRRITPLGGAAGPAYLRLMRQVGDRFVSQAGRAARPPRTGRVFLSRSRLEGASRFMGRAVEDRLDALFAAHGFEVVHPQEMPLGAQIALVRGATEIAGCIGSALHLAVFGMPPGARLFRLRPSYFDLGVDEEVMRGLGGRIEDFVVEAAREPGVPINDGRWSLDAQDLDRLEARLGALYGPVG